MIVDAENNELLLKLVYYGPALSGRTSNLQYAFERSEPERRTNLGTLSTETESLLWFTLAPKTLAPVGGRAVRLALYAAPSPVFNHPSRRVILDGVDGVVFVVDTQVERLEANLECLEALTTNLDSYNRRLSDLPFVIQYNKRDLPNRMPLADVDRALNPQRVPHFDAIARTGVGVFDTLRACAKLAYDRIPPPAGGPYRSMT